MADKVPALARVMRTSYINDVLVEVEPGSAEGVIVKWPAGVDPATCGDNIVPCNEDASPFVGEEPKKK